mgnify:CR=1 FL=1
MPKPYRLQINVDTNDAHVLADWWAETLGWVVEPTDPAFIQRMLDEGYATQDDTRIHNGERVWRGAAAVCPPDEVGELSRRRIVFQDVPEDAFAILHIPRFGNEYQVPIAQGVGLSGVLHKGLAGHYPDTAMVGGVGNFAIAGHRQSHGAIFHHIDQLEPGDPIVVQTDEFWFVYRVSADPHVVLPTATEVIAPNPANPGAPAEVASMTLTTCHPLWSIAERLVVHSELDFWAPVSAGIPSELLEG